MPSRKNWNLKRLGLGISKPRGAARQGRAWLGGAGLGTARVFLTKGNEMETYRLTLEGLSPLFFHRDNLNFAEKVRAWQKDPANKEWSVAGDDRSPAWTWIGYIYHDGMKFGIPSENFMTALREGGAKVKSGKKSNETYKKQTQAGVVVNSSQFELLVQHAGKKKWQPIEIGPFQKLIGDMDFLKHIDTAEAHGFELDVRRAKIGQAKHVRVRPRFDRWMAIGEITVIDSDLSGIKQKVLQTIMDQAGAMVGLGDWRPSSPKSSGTNGKYRTTIEKI